MVVLLGAIVPTPSHLGGPWLRPRLHPDDDPGHGWRLDHPIGKLFLFQRHLFEQRRLSAQVNQAKAAAVAEGARVAEATGAAKVDGAAEPPRGRGRGIVAGEDEDKKARPKRKAPTRATVTVKATAKAKVVATTTTKLIAKTTATVGMRVSSSQAKAAVMQVGTPLAVPAQVFGQHGKAYEARVAALTKGGKGSGKGGMGSRVTVYFPSDHTSFWFPIAEVRLWLA